MGKRDDITTGGRWYRYAQQLWTVVKGDAMADLPAGARVIWLVLYVHADAESMMCNPSINTIGQLAGMNPKHATRHLAALERAGLIARERSVGGRKRTVYRLCVPPDASAHQRNSSSRANPTATNALAQRQQSRQRNTNHNHENINQITKPIEPAHGAYKHGRDGKLPHVEEEDLTDMKRLIDLYCRYCGCERPTQINDGLLKFAAAATHAANCTPQTGRKIQSRPALFAAMIRNNDYTKITQSDEEEASQRLKFCLHGVPGKRRENYDPLE